MSKICVYTCITGDYDSLKKLNYPNKNYDYICFTNNKNITSDFWKVIYIEEDKLDNLTLARKIKILGHEVLKKYDLTIWLDGAMQLRKSLSTFIDECCDLDNYDMIGFKHQERDCIYDEMDACVYFYKETVENVSRLTKFLEKEKYPKHNGLIESTVLVRKNTDEVNKLMKLWFDMLIKYSRRDQLSFDYCLWKYPIKIQMLDMNVFNNDYLVHCGHNNVLFSKKYRVYFGTGHKFDSLLEGEYKYEDGYYLAQFNIPCNCDEFELIVSPFDYVLLNDFDVNIDYEMDCYLVSKYRIFFRDKKIVFRKKIKKNEKIIIKFNFDVLNINMLLNFFSENDILCNDKINELKKINDETNASLNRVLNSRGWKFLEKIRKIKKMIR